MRNLTHIRDVPLLVYLASWCLVHCKVQFILWLLETNEYIRFVSMRLSKEEKAAKRTAWQAIRKDEV